MMFKIFKFKYLIFIYGELKMLSVMKRNVNLIGINFENVFVFINGLKVELKDYNLKLIN